MKPRYKLDTKYKALRLLIVVAPVALTGLVPSCAFTAEDNDNTPDKAVPDLKLQAVDVDFGKAGLTSLMAGDTELLGDGRPYIDYLRFNALEGEKMEQISRPQPLRRSRKQTDNGLELQDSYDWGSTRIAYRCPGDAFNIEVSITNDSDKPLAVANLVLLTLQFPQWPTGPDIEGLYWKQRFSLGIHSLQWGPGLCGDYGEGTFAISSRDDLCFCSLQPSPAGTPGDPVALIASTAVAPGETRSNVLTFQFGPQKSDPLQLIAPTLRDYGKHHPLALNWPDRRPIATLHPSSFHIGAFGPNKQPGNPRGWILGDPPFDVNTDQGRADFKKRMLDFARQSVKVSKGMDAQGVIVWCLEGQEYPHTISYIGSPNMLPEIAPEMDEIADEFFKIFSDAGLRTGVTLRPQELKWNPAYPAQTNIPWFQNDFKVDFVELLDQKIQYAVDRWKCSIFYVDTNVIENRDGKRVWEVMPAQWFAELAKRHPDVLIIPEHETFDYWQTTAPLTELTGASSKVRTIWPKAFSVNLLQSADLSKPEQYAAAKASVAAGDILIFHGWYNAPMNEYIRNIYKETANNSTAPVNNKSPRQKQRQ